MEWFGKQPRWVQAVGVSAALGVAFLAWRRCGCGGAAKAATKGTLDAIVISGPSGVGKGTLIKKLMAEYPGRFGFSVSHTTRAPRAGEVDGRDYHFTTREKLLQMVDNGEFLENCEVHGNIYGTTKRAFEKVRASGQVCIIEVDVQGAQKIKKQAGSDLTLHFIFVTAPMAELEKRIVGRGSDAPEKVKVRLQTAEREQKFVDENPTFFNTILVNDNLEETYGRLKGILKSYSVL